MSISTVAPILPFSTFRRTFPEVLCALVIAGRMLLGPLVLEGAPVGCAI